MKTWTWSCGTKLQKSRHGQSTCGLKLAGMIFKTELNSLINDFAQWNSRQVEIRSYEDKRNTLKSTLCHNKWLSLLFKAEQECVARWRNCISCPDSACTHFSRHLLSVYNGNSDRTGFSSPSGTIALTVKNKPCLSWLSFFVENIMTKHIL